MGRVCGTGAPTVTEHVTIGTDVLVAPWPSSAIRQKTTLAMTGWPVVRLIGGDSSSSRSGSWSRFAGSVSRRARI